MEFPLLSQLCALASDAVAHAATNITADTVRASFDISNSCTPYSAYDAALALPVYSHLSLCEISELEIAGT